MEGSPLKQTLITEFCDPETNVSSEPRKRRKVSRVRSRSKVTTRKISSYFKSVEDELGVKLDSKEPLIGYRRDMFEKYGILIPTLNELLIKRDEINNYSNSLKKILQEFDESNTMEDKENISDESENGVEVLSCENLTSQQLLKYFKANAKYCLDIITGRQKSNRALKFLEDVHDKIGFNSLCFNTSMAAFTRSQIQELAHLSYKRFRKRINADCVNSYLFKVLLPELCLKIFMDVHNLDREQAQTYLDSIPIHDSEVL